MNIKNHKIAHRGVFNNRTIPENSMKSFQKAISLDYSIELDVQLTKDNVLVVFHDYDLERMTSFRGILQDLCYSDIQKLRLLNTKEKIPTFQEVLKLVKGKVLLDIEIKNTKRISETCSILMKELDGYSPFILKSFNPQIVRYLKKHYPSIEVGYLIDRKYSNKFLQWFLSSNFMIHHSKADFLAIHKKLAKTHKFQKLKKKYPLFLWTIKKEDTFSNEEYVLICNDLIH